MKTMTAVEWLEKELSKNGSGAVKTFADLFEQAKAMFEEQMAMADKNGQDRNQYNRDLEYGGAEYWDNEPLEFEQWYNETFNS
jgi:hypothetical protein